MITSQILEVRSTNSGDLHHIRTDEGWYLAPYRINFAASVGGIRPAVVAEHVILARPEVDFCTLAVMQMTGWPMCPDYIACKAP